MAYFIKESNQDLFNLAARLAKKYDQDSFIYGKVTKQQNLMVLPLLPGPIVLKNETVINIRALQIGTHK